MYMYMYWGWDEGWKTTFEASSANMNECLKVHVFINVALTLVGYRKPPKLDYCFITSTSVVPVTVSIQI